MIMAALADYCAYKALDPLFEMVGDVIGASVDGEHFFDRFAENAVWDNLFPVPGTKPVFRGRRELMDAFRGYGDVFQIKSMSDLQVHRSEEDDGTEVFVMEYKGHGHAVQTDKPYHNSYVSIVHIRNRKIFLWRDYADQMVAIEAVGGLGPIQAMLGTT
jgi:ketosteroid isomerase-like protein